VQKRGLDVGRSMQRVEPEATGKCPICGTDSVHETRPFCSLRCANVDLNRWLSEGYSLPSDNEDDGLGEEP